MECIDFRSITVEVDYMSDIIPFPRSKDKLIRDIKIAYNQDDLEEMYSLFDNYEEHF